jgi:hypothetical protein
LSYEETTKQSNATSIDWHREIARDQESNEADEEDHADGRSHVNGIKDEGHADDHEGQKQLQVTPPGPNL